MKGVIVMNTSQLECFLAVCEHLNFSKAAREVRLTQPAVSHQISSLEDELGVKLFFRTSKSVKLTVEGFKFKSFAEKMMKDFIDAKRFITDSSTIKRVELGIGCHNRLELCLLSPIIKKVASQNSNFYPNIKNIPYESISNLLADNSIQVMLGFKDQRGKSVGTVFTELFKCKTAVLCAPGYFSEEQKSSGDFSGRAILISKPKCCEAVFNMQFKEDHSKRTEEPIFSDGYEAAISLIRAGLGYMIFPLVPGYSEEGLEYIPLSGSESTSFGVHRNRLADSGIVKSFIRAAVETAEGLNSTP